MKTATPHRLSHSTSVIKHQNSLGTGKRDRREAESRLRAWLISTLTSTAQTMQTVQEQNGTWFTLNRNNINATDNLETDNGLICMLKIWLCPSRPHTVHCAIC